MKIVLHYLINTLGVLFLCLNLAWSKGVVRKLTCWAQLEHKPAGTVEFLIDDRPQEKILNIDGKKEKYVVIVRRELMDGKFIEPYMMIGMSGPHKIQRPWVVSNMTLPIDTKKHYELTHHYDLSYYAKDDTVDVNCEYTRSPNK